MSYLLTALALLVELAFGLLTTLFTLRLALPLVRANFRNPICQAIYRLSHPAVAPLGRLLKPIGRFDLASALLAWLCQCLKVVALFAIVGTLPKPAAALVLGMAGWLDLALLLLLGLIIVRALFSFFPVGNVHPVAVLVGQLTEPVLKPIRRVVPLLGGLDLSPMVAVILLILARILLVAPLQDLGVYLARG